MSMRAAAARRQSVARSGLETLRGSQVAAGLAGFLGLCGLVLAGFFRTVAGLIAIGRPTRAAATGSGSGLK
jgi:hypothetical protein